MRSPRVNKNAANLFDGFSYRGAGMSDAGNSFVMPSMGSAVDRNLVSSNIFANAASVKKSHLVKQLLSPTAMSSTNEALRIENGSHV